jgi:putative endonuclease
MVSGRTGQAAGQTAARASSTKERGDAAEDQALAFLQARGLRLLRRHFHTPGRGGGEIDLIMQDADGTLVFVEVRQRRGRSHGGAAATVGAVKQRRLVFAARHFLSRLQRLPACRFDVVAIEGEGPQARIDWVVGAFTADGW